MAKQRLPGNATLLWHSATLQLMPSDTDSHIFKAISLVLIALNCDIFILHNIIYLLKRVT